MESENRHDFDATLATFSHPRYELIATGEVYDGEDAVRGYYARTRATFTDQRNEVIALHHTDDGVIVEFDLLGTHTARWRGWPRQDAHSVAAWSRCSCSTTIASTANASTSTPGPSSASSACSATLVLSNRAAVPSLHHEERHERGDHDDADESDEHGTPSCRASPLNQIGPNGRGT